MTDRSYKVILDGTIRNGVDRGEVVRKLAALFNKDVEVVEKLLLAAPRQIRKGLNAAEAQKYKQVLERIGASVRVERDDLDRPGLTPAVPQPEKPARTGRMPVAPDRDEANRAEILREAPQAEKLAAQFESTRKGKTPVPAKRDEPAFVPEPPPTGTLPVPPHREKPEVVREPAVATGAMPVPAPRDQSAVDRENATCPKCGYVAYSEQDVLLVRGDCPRCGLRVRKDVVIEDLALEPLDAAAPVRRGLEVYQDHTPAAWNRRAVAAIHTLNAFLVVYTVLFLFAAFMLVPLESIPEQMAYHFIDMVLDLFPLFLVSMALLVVLFAFPVFNAGLTWGQQMADIQVLYTDEAQVGGLYFTLGARYAAALILTLVPGAVLVWAGSRFGFFESARVWAVVMLGMASLAWIASWITMMQREDERGVLDLAAGTVQTEEAPLAPNAMNQALLQLLPVLSFWLLFTAVIPLLVRLFSSPAPK
ncbi:MAG: hypothetical protein HY914_14010 [Desulfomonile tiedjei]|nr:hypothetical protein [Desulfomonile tiedjei]